jgi:predicted ATP-dependent protease
MPTRITATTRLGSGEVVDIQREVKLGGAIHSKGVLILSSLLGARYARQQPLSLSASLSFEQTYGTVDGDSASLAEFCVLLSSLADVPIRQDFAVTGSINQHGEVQAIGGVNEKIEGFFDICRSRGLSGTQAAIVPASNVRHLMLHPDVVAAVEAGRFRIHAVATVDDALELLTGMTVGMPDADGTYPEGSFNRRVADRLSAMTSVRRDFVSAQKSAGESK